MVNIMIQIERRQYFQTITGNLQYSEYWPPHEHQDQQICGCIREVKERPEGNSDHVNQDICFSDDSSEFRLASMLFHFREKTKQFNPHSYFVFEDGGRSVRIEVTTHDCDQDILNPRKAFFGNLYLGNSIDTSRLMNGHSPSRVVDLSKIKSQDIWMHHCEFGDEVMARITGPEVQLWTRIFELAQDINHISGPILSDHSGSISSIHEKVSTSRLPSLVDEIRQLIIPMSTMESFQKTSVFETGSELLLATQNSARAQPSN